MGNDIQSGMSQNFLKGFLFSSTINKPPTIPNKYENISFDDIKLELNDEKQKNEQGDLLLHIALYKRISFEEIKLILNAYVEGAKEIGSEGYLPLHIAKLTLKDLKANPEGAKESNSNGGLPLHWASSSNAYQSVKLLLETYPEGAKKQLEIGECNNNLPLNIAINEKASAELCLCLLKANPAGAKHRDAYNKLPIECVSDKDLIIALIKADFPLYDNQAYSWTKFLEVFKADNYVTLSVSVISELFDEYFSDQPDICYDLAYCYDEIGRTAISIVHDDVKKFMTQYLFFMGRFEIRHGPPQHKSKTCAVFLAIDHKSEKKNVALKFMVDREGFRRELNSRVDVSPKFLLPVDLAFDSDSSCDADQQFASYISKVASLRDYKYLLVLPASDRSLAGIILDEDICATDMGKVKQVFSEVVVCLDAIHKRGKIHGDIKPHNVIRLSDGQMCLIDMDAAVIFGEFCGSKVSSAYIPPEMIKSSGSGSYEICRELPADRSYDIWSLGCLLYYLCTGETLFQTNTEDNLVDTTSWQMLHVWSIEVKKLKLSKISDPILRNMLSQLLYKDATKRPDTEHILSHPYLTGRVVGRLPGDAATTDVFISYRQDSDKSLVANLFEKLKALNLRIFWDQVSLADGKNWQEGFATGLCSSSTFVPIISRAAIKDRFERLDETSSVDNVLLEHQLALEFNKRDLITHIYPIYVGDIDTSGHYSNYFSSGCVPVAADISVSSLDAKASENLERLGLGTPLLPKITVKAVVDRINMNNGGFVQGSEDIDTILIKLANNVNKMIVDNQITTTVSSSLSSSSSSSVLSDDTTLLRQQLAEKDQKLSEYSDKIIELERRLCTT